MEKPAKIEITEIFTTSWKKNPESRCQMRKIPPKWQQTEMKPLYCHELFQNPFFPSCFAIATIITEKNSIISPIL